jgi:cysteinyl-tRNA synthetase
MANVWMHNGFLQVEGQKMSKSLGNFITINELLETDKFGGRKWPGEVLRLAMLMTHYREPIDFSVKRLEEAFSRSVELFVAAWDAPAGGSPDSETLDFLSDDLNTPAAVARLVKLARENAPSLATTMALLGLRLDDSSFRNFLILKRRIGEDGESVAEAQSKILSSLGTTGAAVNDAIAARLAALNARDFATADQIRNDLLAQGIQLMDYKDEAGQRQTKWEVKR